MVYQLGGLFSGITNFFSNLFTRIVNSAIWSGIIKIIFMLLYGLVTVLFSVLDFLNTFFQKIVGISSDPVLIKGVGEVDGDLVIYIIQNKVVIEMFITLSIIAVFLLIVSTIVAIIRSEYKWDKEGNSKGPIFGRALKAFAMYLTVPIACLLGITMSNQVLKMVNEATSQGSSNISGMIFAASVLNSNRIRNDRNFFDAYKATSSVSLNNERGVFNINLQSSNAQFDSPMATELANNIDSAFKTSELKTFYNFDNSRFGGNTGDWDNQMKSNGGRYHDGWKYHFNLNWESIKTGNYFTVYNWELVWFYYDLIKFDYLIAILTSLFVLSALWNMTLGVTMRIYELVTLFIISPPIIALMPLDEGAAFKNWTKKFIGKTLAAYGGVVSINLFFFLVPILQQITFFTDNSRIGGILLKDIWPVFPTLFSYFATLLVIIAGAASIETLSKMISELIGAEDAGSAGQGISAKVGGALKTVAKAAAAPAKFAVDKVKDKVIKPIASAGANAAKSAGSAFGGVAKKGLSAMAGGKGTAFGQMLNKSANKSFGKAKDNIKASGGALKKLPGGGIPGKVKGAAGAYKAAKTEAKRFNLGQDAKRADKGQNKAAKAHKSASAARGSAQKKMNAEGGGKGRTSKDIEAAGGPKTKKEKKFIAAQQEQGSSLAASNAAKKKASAANSAFEAFNAANPDPSKKPSAASASDSSGGGFSGGSGIAGAAGIGDGGGVFQSGAQAAAADQRAAHAKGTADARRIEGKIDSLADEVKDVKKIAKEANKHSKKAADKADGGILGDIKDIMS